MLSNYNTCQLNLNLSDKVITFLHLLLVCELLWGMDIFIVIVNNIMQDHCIVCYQRGQF